MNIRFTIRMAIEAIAVLFVTINIFIISCSQKNNNTYFESVKIDGIGDMKKLEGMTLGDIQNILSNTDLCILGMTNEIPTGWPHAIRCVATNLDNDRVVFAMNVDGGNWLYFDGYISTHGKQNTNTLDRSISEGYPALIYKRTKTNGLYSYIPVVRLSFNLHTKKCDYGSYYYCMRKVERTKNGTTAVSVPLR